MKLNKQSLNFSQDIHAGLILKRNLSGQYFENVLRFLEPMQEIFLNSHLKDIPEAYRAKWPIDKLHWWSRPEEYIYIYLNIFKYLKTLETNPNILEFGPGCSFLSYALLENSDLNTLYIEDIDNSVLDFWNSVGSQDGLNYLVHNKNNKKLDFFDLIYSVSVLEHVDDPNACFDDLVDQLKVGGRIILTLDIDINKESKYGINIEDLIIILSNNRIIFDDVPIINALAFNDILASPKHGWYIESSNHMAKFKRKMLEIKNYYDYTLQGRPDPRNIFVLKVAGTKIN